MQVRLIKVQRTTTRKIEIVDNKTNTKKQEEKEVKYFTFFLELDNGELLPISPRSYDGADGKHYSNYDKLTLVADLVTNK